MLFGDRLADKLAPFPAGPEVPGARIPRPDRPGRPAELRFAPAKTRTRLPPPDALRDSATAARLLHAFANHELLAIELMALALLRFGDMDPRTRRDLVATIEDEQRHLRGYLGRLDALGATFGDHPVSGFFWHALAGAPDLAAWHAGMGLTLEQANLDFTTWYARAFREAGDDATAALLDEVHKDEIAHVARGLRAFQAARPGPLWERWSAALLPPLSPRRARGPTLDRVARRAAGIPDAFTDRLAVASHSRGRDPDVWWFDVTSESDHGAGLLASGARGDVARDLASLPVALAAEDDIVLLAEPCSRAWLDALAAAGFALPRREVVDPAGAAPPLGPVGRSVAWGAGRSGDRLLGGPRMERHPLGDKTRSAAAVAQLHPELTEAFGPGLVAADDLPVVVHDAAELDAAVARLRARGRDRIVLKAPWSSSGMERIRLLHPHEPDRAQRGWIAARLARGPLRVEPWFDAVLDLSLHLGGTPRWLVCATDRGRFRAAFPGRVTASLSPEIARFLVRDGADPKRLDRLGRALQTALEARGVPQPTSLDALLVRDGPGLALHPLLEVNPRWTMGRVALRLARRVDGRSACAWIHRPVRGDAREVLRELQGRLPLDVGGAPGRIRRGVVPTNDPSTARRLLTALVVAPTRAELHAVVPPPG